MLNIITGNCNNIIKYIKSNSIDTIITDPPYALKFMSKKWDYELPSVKCFQQMLRIAKPGATLLCFGGTRTFHRMACNIEDAGWQIRDCIMWLYGSGFPKSHDISKAIDKTKGKKRKIIGYKPIAYADSDCWGIPNKNSRGNKTFGVPISSMSNKNKAKAKGTNFDAKGVPITKATTKSAQLWDGWSTALKPAFEPIIVAMKPLDGTYAQNAEKYGVAGLNIDGGRISCTGGSPSAQRRKKYKPPPKVYSSGWTITTRQGYNDTRKGEQIGRWPANVILDEEAGRMLDNQTGELPTTNKPVAGRKRTRKRYFADSGTFDKASNSPEFYGDTGGPARFFYCAKASKAERNSGLNNTDADNNHPTVKPLKLMEYLCTLTKTPTGGIVLDPFMGSGTTGIACKLTGRHFIGIELDKGYCKLAKLRMKAVKRIKPKNAVSKKKIFVN